MRRIPVRHVGIPLAEVVQVLGVEESAQPYEVPRSQLGVRDDIDRNVRHALRNLQRSDRRDLLPCQILRAVKFVMALQVDPELCRGSEVLRETQRSVR